MAKKAKKPFTTNGRIEREAQAIVKEVQAIVAKNQLCQGEYTIHVGTAILRNKCEVSVFSNRTGNIVGQAIVDISWVDLFDDSNSSYWKKAAETIIKSLGFNNCQKVENVRKYEFTF